MINIDKDVKDIMTCFMPHYLDSETLTTNDKIYYQKEAVEKALFRILTDSVFVCKMYFDIAASEIGEDEVRKRRDTMIDKLNSATRKNGS